jgi:hypothetical protein
MPGIFTIRLKAFLLSVIFTGNFLVVCHCSAATGPGRVGMRQHCCCRQRTQPCKGADDCPGKQEVKFNLMEKKVAGPVHLNPVAALLEVTDYMAPVAAARWIKRKYATPYFYHHPPPDRLALFHCYLI